jgi:hypothetical protein
MDLLFGKVSLGEKAVVERIGYRAGPRGVERLPVTLRAERGAKMVEERHRDLLWRSAISV